MFRNLILLLLGLCLALVLASCGSSGCFVVSLNVTPQAATLDHSAPPPGNAETFFVFGGVSGGCAITARIPESNRRDVTWSVSDTTNVSISNANDDSYGTATCLGATSGTVTVTATLPADQNHGKSVVGTAQLTCN